MLKPVYKIYLVLFFSILLPWFRISLAIPSYIRTCQSETHGVQCSHANSNSQSQKQGDKLK